MRRRLPIGTAMHVDLCACGHWKNYALSGAMPLAAHVLAASVAWPRQGMLDAPGTCLWHPSPSTPLTPPPPPAPAACQLRPDRSSPATPPAPPTPPQAARPDPRRSAAPATTDRQEHQEHGDVVDHVLPGQGAEAVPHLIAGEHAGVGEGGHAAGQQVGQAEDTQGDREDQG